jgi:hypothetical protein
MLPNTVPAKSDNHVAIDRGARQGHWTKINKWCLEVTMIPKSLAGSPQFLNVLRCYKSGGETYKRQRA